ncbi:MAG: glycoside hydrolase family 27 protein [Patescibacteria group bacterium]|nr:glycoside hydrolase family 27 protein [Patescibacteria group bacterium]
MKKRIIFAVAALLLASFSFSQAVPSNGLSSKPMMIVGSWYTYGPNITQAQFRALVSAAATDGVLSAGYNIVVLEEPHTTLTGSTLSLNTTYFPSDTWSTLASYVHSEGMKFGVYATPGATTCGGNPGEYGNETAIINAWAAAGVDYIEDDWCSAGTQYGSTQAGAINAFEVMGNAIYSNSSARPILSMIFLYGEYNSTTWYNALAGANAARVALDIGANWNSVSTIGFSVATPWSRGYVAPGYFQFGDQLMAGCGTCVESGGSLSVAEEETQFNQWSIMASPLMIGGDIINMSSTDLNTMLNSDVIAVDQDSLGKQGWMMSSVPCGSANCEVWGRPLSGNKWAIELVNLDSAAHTISANWQVLHLPENVYAVRDLWAHSDLGTMSGYTASSLGSHASMMLELTPVSQGEVTTGEKNVGNVSR